MPDLRYESSPLSWGELSAAPALRSCTFPFHANPSAPVTAIHLIDDLNELRSLRPGAVIILAAPLHEADWSVSMALRYAWERNSCAVLCGLDPAVSAATSRLARRLGVTVGFHGEKPSALAAQLFALAHSPQAARDHFVVETLTELARCEDLDDALALLSDVFGGASVDIVEGTDWSGDPGVSGRDEEQGASVVTTSVPLTSSITDHRPALRVVHPDGAAVDLPFLRKVLTLASGHVSTLHHARAEGALSSAARDENLLARVLRDARESDPDDDEDYRGPTPCPAPAAWRLDDPYLPVVLLPRAGSAPSVSRHVSQDAAMVRGWPIGPPRPIPYREGWIWWFTSGPGDVPGRALLGIDRRGRLGAEDLRPFFDSLRSAVRELPFSADLVIGVGSLCRGPRDLPRGIQHATVAARVARFHPQDPVRAFDQLGEDVFLAFLGPPDEVDSSPALDLLGTLGAERDAENLLETLAVYFDSGSSPQRAAQQLGIHRNTLAARLQKLKDLGIDVQDTGRHLSLHLAARILLQRERADQDRPPSPGRE